MFKGTERHMLVDATNVLYRTFFKVLKTDPDHAGGMAMHTALVTMLHYYNKVKPTKVILAFDRSSWRKQFMTREDCVSKLLYKGNRRQNMTAKEQEQFNNFLEHINEFEEMLRQETGVTVLRSDELEADDLISGWIQYVELDPTQSETPEIVIITTDSDMSQLLSYENVSILSPATKELIKLDKYDNDAAYYLFQKCIRGDSTDNIQSAFPRVRETRIKAAYRDPYEFANMMDVTWKNHDGREMRVGDLYKENRTLIDLHNQPERIQDLMMTVIHEEIQRPKRLMMFKILGFCKRHELTNIAKNIDNYLKMLA